MHVVPFLAADWLSRLHLPNPNSHKGQNGKLLIVGGSQLFHAASKWSLDVASKFVDMVFYASTPSNNELVKAAKQEFWNGIVVERTEMEYYAAEADCILIGPGMERSAETEAITTELIVKFPTKKWVVDAGALQMISPAILPTTAIITPHPQELRRWANRAGTQADITPETPTEAVKLWEDIYSSADLPKPAATIIKGPVDMVITPSITYEVMGGNAGMTKGGTGDVLAGLVAALYCTNSAEIAALIGSYINKKAGDGLYVTVGPFFNATDLVEEIPYALWDSLNPAPQA